MTTLNLTECILEVIRSANVNRYIIDLVCLELAPPGVTVAYKMLIHVQGLTKVEFMGLYSEDRFKLLITDWE